LNQKSANNKSSNNSKIIESNNSNQNQNYNRPFQNQERNQPPPKRPISIQTKLVLEKLPRVQPNQPRTAGNKQDQLKANDDELFDENFEIPEFEDDFGESEINYSASSSSIPTQSTQTTENCATTPTPVTQSSSGLGKKKLNLSTKKKPEQSCQGGMDNNLNQSQAPTQTEPIETKSQDISSSEIRSQAHQNEGTDDFEAYLDDGEIFEDFEDGFFDLPDEDELTNDDLSYMNYEKELLMEDNEVESQRMYDENGKWIGAVNRPNQSRNQVPQNEDLDLEIPDDEAFQNRPQPQPQHPYIPETDEDDDIPLQINRKQKNSNRSDSEPIELD